MCFKCSNVMHLIKKFSCPYCDYSEVVSGREYNNLWSQSGYSTFVCNKCNRLTETECREKVLDTDIIEGKIKSVSKWKIIDAICLWCGTNDLSKWDRSEPICPKCGSGMNEGSHEFTSIRYLTFDNINEFIFSKKIFVLFVTSNQCAPCFVRLPIFEELAVELSNMYIGILEFGVYVTDDKQSIYEYFEPFHTIETIPSIVLFYSGRFVGFIDKNINKPILSSKLEKIIKTILN